MLDFGHPWALASGAFISLVGTALFIYGKKQANFKCLGAGAIFCVYPMFVDSLAVMWGLFGAGAAALWWFSREG